MHRLVLVLALASVSVQGRSARGQAQVRFESTLQGGVTAAGNTLGLSGDVTTGGPGIDDAIGAFVAATDAVSEAGWPAGTTYDWRLAGSSAWLDLPAGATVVHAELVWGGSFLGIDVRGDAVATLVETPVTLNLPGGSSHVVTPDPATATSLITGPLGQAGYYLRSADVTALVDESGRYGVAGVPATLSTSASYDAAGWTLLVAWEAAGWRVRHVALLVSDLFVAPGGDEASIQLPLSCTADLPVAPQGHLWVAALEGDLDRSGDTLRFSGSESALGQASSALQGPNNAADNFFGSQVNDADGLLDVRGDFGGVNHGAGGLVVGARQGWDLTRVSVFGQLAAGSSRALLRPTSTDDEYAVAAVGLAIDASQPRFTALHSALVASADSAVVADVVTVTTTLSNEGDQAAIGLRYRLADPLPAGVRYVTGSTHVDGVPADVTSDTLLTAGLQLSDLAPGATTIVTFEVQIDARPIEGGFAVGAQVDYDWTDCEARSYSGGAETGVAVVVVSDCGDGLVDGGEACDDGNLVGSDGCSASCEVERAWRCDGPPGSTGHCRSTCGDGLVTPAVEACDDGNTDALDGCSATCEVESGYRCTDDSAAPPDSTCTSICGDGVVAAGAESCDDGEVGVGDGCASDCTVERGWSCSGPPGTSAHCVTTCGDGLVGVPVEACDDGGVEERDGCAADCQLEPGFACVNSMIDTDDQPDTVCVSACGDGRLALGPEACDDGEGDAGDGCDDSCAIEPGWSCTAEAGARSLCQASACGDGIAAGAEECDDGGAEAGDGCSEGCRFEIGWSCADALGDCRPICGDGIALGPPVEACDDGNVDDDDGCDADCRVEPGWYCDEPGGCQTRCGDAIVALGEACDDANDVGGDGCAANCQVEEGWSCDGREPSSCEPGCGDGRILGPEGCDDENLEDGDGCAASCTVEEGFSCRDEPSSCFADLDQDGVLDDGDDSGSFTDNPCPPAETVGCDDNCREVPNAAQEDGDLDGVGDACQLPYLGPRTEGGGGGCQAGGGSPLGWMLLAAAAMLLWPRRRRGLVSLVLTIACAPLTAGEVAAQQVDPRLLDPIVTPTGVLSVDSSLPAGDLVVFGSVNANYANDELVTRVQPRVSERGPLRNRWTTTLAAGVGLFDRLDVALAMPLQQIQTGTAGDATDEFSVGDLRLHLKVRLTGPEPGAGGFGVALASDVTFPTGGGASFSGDGFLTVTPRVIADYRTAGGLVLAMNAGYRVRPESTVADLAVGHELRWGLGAEIPLDYLDLAATGELIATVGLGETAVDSAGVERRKVPVEVLGGLRWRSTAGLTISAAAGAGLTRGYGAPDHRVLLTIGYGGPAPAPADAVDTGAEGVGPVTQQPAGRDLATPPAFAPIAPLDAQVLDRVAAADPDPDQDGVENKDDECVDVPEDYDGFEDDDGCPDPDNDQDGVEDAADKCPDEKETVNGNADEDGCPDEGESLVADEAGEIRIREQIRFALGGSAISSASFPILAQVARIMNANRRVARFRIEGHTDNRGNSEFNVALSSRRAASVRQHLMKLGVDGDRLEIKGWGSTRPIASNATSTGRANNRRVEFRPVDPDEAGSVTEVR